MQQKLVAEKNKLLISITKLLEGPMIFLGFVWLVLLLVELVWGLWQQVFIGTEFSISKPPLNLLCILFMANISYYLIEKPFLRLRAKYEKKNRTAQTRPAYIQLPFTKGQEKGKDALKK